MSGQYALLESAKPILNPDAAVVAAVGGRMPLEILEQLFGDSGYRLKELSVGFKPQSEALIDFIGYARFEQQYGVSFEFYRYGAGNKCLKRNGITNPCFTASGKEIKRLLHPYRVNATQALSLHRKGVTIGHTVHMLSARRIESVR